MLIKSASTGRYLLAPTTNVTTMLTWCWSLVLLCCLVLLFRVCLATACTAMMKDCLPGYCACNSACFDWHSKCGCSFVGRADWHARVSGAARVGLLVSTGAYQVYFVASGCLETKIRRCCSLSETTGRDRLINI